ncbi:MAG: cytochrome c [Bacteroidia bacterium]|nr:cytochrome c [Bacteroidia bacterium]
MFKKSGLVVLITVFLASCSDPNHPGYEYMPDMAHTIAYKTYEVNTNFGDSSNALLPAEGTIPRGHMPYPYKKDSVGFEMSASIENPVPYSDEVLGEGKRLYGIYCSPCHGKSGNGDGLVVTKGGYAIPPLYTDENAAMSKHNVKNMTAGQIYHTIMVGSEFMGSYASQLSESERWQIVHYIQTMQGAKSLELGSLVSRLEKLNVTKFNLYFIPTEGDNKLFVSETGELTQEMKDLISNAGTGDKILLDELFSDSGKRLNPNGFIYQI